MEWLTMSFNQIKNCVIIVIRLNILTEKDIIRYSSLIKYNSEVDLSCIHSQPNMMTIWGIENERICNFANFRLSKMRTSNIVFGNPTTKFEILILTVKQFNHQISKWLSLLTHSFSHLIVVLVEQCFMTWA